MADGYGAVQPLGNTNQPPPVQQDPYYGAPQPGYGPPPDNYNVQGAAPGADDQPLLHQTQTPRYAQQSIALEKESSLDPREVFDHDKFDIDSKPIIDGIQPMKAEWLFKAQLVMSIFVLFNAITTIMIILTGFRRGVAADQREKFGHKQFEAITGFVIYFPLVFFVVIVFQFNNFYSERTFYSYLLRGVIIDFPQSASGGYLLKHFKPVTFTIVWIAYCITTIYVLIRFKASFGVMIIFFNNMLVGIGLMWYNQQSIENRFVSVSNFIQAFPDRGGEYGNMDEQSLHSAGRYLKDVVLVESDTPAYNSYMRLWWWKNRNYSGLMKAFHHVLLWVLVFGLAGISVAYFYLMGFVDLRNTWENVISPCISSCAVGYSHFGSVALDADQCQSCVCTCLNVLQYRDDEYLSNCHSFFSGSRAGICESFSSRCPGSCKWN